MYLWEILGFLSKRKRFGYLFATSSSRNQHSGCLLQNLSIIVGSTGMPLTNKALMETY